MNSKIIFGIIALVAAGIIAYVVMNQTEMPTTTLPGITPVPTQSPPSVSAQVPCEVNQGRWLEAFNECEGIEASVCDEMGGTYNECASACRHDPEAEMCIEVCVAVCSF
jgi:hypothetical protein